MDKLAIYECFSRGENVTYTWLKGKGYWQLQIHAEDMATCKDISNLSKEKHVCVWFIRKYYPKMQGSDINDIARKKLKKKEN